MNLGSASDQPHEPRQDPEARAANRARFELELEFVQALANPFYLQSLAQQNILTQPSFVNFLKYLTYWKDKDYARFLHYPQALHHLDLLQNEQFRKEIAKDEWREYLNQKQFDHWRTWREDPQRFTGILIDSQALIFNPTWISGGRNNKMNSHK
ncbi:SOH1-domain-containing [Pyrrhoderma noxium]|uniref:Mediator of RNA polymerase II transcription subunit 31 n=1 Tax=Pyrrhoderma noxium TaxID=2282107 RepID=A0A286UL31_9AGAM|nr:SOH1-domain-containing [Pyrrhoderma noxium]